AIAPGATKARPPLLGQLIYHCLPIRRRVILANLQRVFGDRLAEKQIRRLAQAHYAHLAQSIWEIATDTFRAPVALAAGVQVENADSALRAQALGRGVLVLTAHLGNWEVAAPRGVARCPAARGRVHFVRRPLPPWLDRAMLARFRRAGIGVMPK